MFTTKKYHTLISFLVFLLSAGMPLGALGVELTLPVHKFPSNGATLTPIQWNKSDWTDASTSTTSVAYLFEVSNSPVTATTTGGIGAFTSTTTFMSNALSKSEINTIGMPEGVWYWHVKAITYTATTTGTSTSWTTPWKVTVKKQTQTNTNTGNTNDNNNGGEDNQANAGDPNSPDNNEKQFKDQNGNDIGAASIGALASCSVNAILGRLISSTVGSAIQQLSSTISGVFSSYIKDQAINAVRGVIGQEVPTRDKTVIDQTTKAKSELRRLTAKTTGVATADLDSVLGGFISSISSISLDSIMFCVVNEIMTYITQSTINWINSGFNGNPVFVQNPQALFKQIADRETANLANQIMGVANQAQRQVVNGLVQNVAGGIINIAEPLKQGAIRSIIGADSSYQGNTMSPRLAQNYNSFVSGQQWLGFGALMEVSNNNYFETNTRLLNERNRRILAEQENQKFQLQLSNGYRIPTKCPEGRTYSDGGCDPQYAQTTMPYTAIRDEIQSRNNMKYLRISFAKDFDSVVTALVNQLVKIAVNKIYESTSKRN